MDTKDKEINLKIAKRELKKAMPNVSDNAADQFATMIFNMAEMLAEDGVTGPLVPKLSKDGEDAIVEAATKHYVLETVKRLEDALQAYPMARGHIAATALRILQERYTEATADEEY